MNSFCGFYFLPLQCLLFSVELCIQQHMQHFYLYFQICHFLRNIAFLKFLRNIATCLQNSPLWSQIRDRNWQIGCQERFYCSNKRSHTCISHIDCTIPIFPLQLRPESCKLQEVNSITDYMICKAAKREALIKYDHVIHMVLSNPNSSAGFWGLVLRSRSLLIT